MGNVLMTLYMYLNEYIFARALECVYVYVCMYFCVGGEKKEKERGKTLRVQNVLSRGHRTQEGCFFFFL